MLRISELNLILPKIIRMDLVPLGRSRRTRKPPSRVWPNWHVEIVVPLWFCNPGCSNSFRTCQENVEIKTLTSTAAQVISGLSERFPAYRFGLITWSTLYCIHVWACDCRPTVICFLEVLTNKNRRLVWCERELHRAVVPSQLED